MLGRTVRILLRKLCTNRSHIRQRPNNALEPMARPYAERRGSARTLIWPFLSMKFELDIDRRRQRSGTTAVIGSGGCESTDINDSHSHSRSAHIACGELAASVFGHAARRVPLPRLWIFSRKAPCRQSAGRPCASVEQGWRNDLRKSPNAVWDLQHRQERSGA